MVKTTRCLCICLILLIIWQQNFVFFWSVFRLPVYLDSHQYLLLVRWEVVTLSQEDFSKGSFSQFSLQHNVVSLNMLDDWKKDRQTEEGTDLSILSNKHRWWRKVTNINIKSIKYIYTTVIFISQNILKINWVLVVFFFLCGLRRSKQKELAW